MTQSEAAVPPSSVTDSVSDSRTGPLQSSDGDEARRCLGGVETVVVKVGSAVLAGSGRLDRDAIEALAQSVQGLRDRGLRVVLVVSGAVAAMPR